MAVSKSAVEGTQLKSAQLQQSVRRYWKGGRLSSFDRVEVSETKDDPAGAAGVLYVNEIVWKPGVIYVTRQDSQQFAIPVTNVISLEW